MAYRDNRAWPPRPTNEEKLGSDAARAEHHGALARGEERSVRQGKDGNWHSYRPEEYQTYRYPARLGTSIPGYVALLLVTAASLAVCVAVTAALIAGGKFHLSTLDSWMLLTGIVMLVAALAMFLHYLRKLVRAAGSRRRRGLPPPQ